MPLEMPIENGVAAFEPRFGSQFIAPRGFARGFATYLADDFQRYPEAFTNGSVHPFWEHGEHFSEWVSGLTHPLQRLVVGKILPEMFDEQLKTGIHVLDVGCGAGRLIFKLAENYPNCRFVGIDAEGGELFFGEIVGVGHGRAP